MPIFEAPGPLSVVIALNVADLRVTASDRTDASVDVRPSDPSSSADVKAAEAVRVECSGGRLRVKAPKQRRRYSAFGGRESVDVIIEVPNGARIDGHCGLGDFRAEGSLGDCRYVSGTGHVTLDRTAAVWVVTGAGDVTLNHAAGAAEVAGAGAIRVGEIDGSAVIKNLNGDTWIGAAAGDLRCSAANGDIRVGQVVRGSINLATANGEVEVGIREGTAALLDLRSQFGEVRNSLQPSAGPEASDETVEVRARSGYGDIVIRRALNSKEQP